DLLQLWKNFRQDLGKDTDPTDWYLGNFHYGMTTASPACVVLGQMSSPRLKE
ncbi:unnamed protein product, partial [marine sediment metagenome]